jgi:hypothetical protein
MRAPPVVMGNAAGFVATGRIGTFFDRAWASWGRVPDAPRWRSRRHDEWYRFHASKYAIFWGFTLQVYRSRARCVGWF